MSRSISLDSPAYAERNWGHSGFPPQWWWGQAQGFDDPDLCVAFAGGTVVIGTGRLQATAIVIGNRHRVIRFGNPIVAPGRIRPGVGEWSLRSRSPGWSIDVEGIGGPAADAPDLPLPLPDLGHCQPAVVRQHPGGQIYVVLRRRGRLVFAGRSAIAGLERGELPEGA